MKEFIFRRYNDNVTRRVTAHSYVEAQEMVGVGYKLFMINKIQDDDHQS